MTHAVHLLAPRLRVEERQLLAAFSARGYEASLVDPGSLDIALSGTQPSAPAVVIDRGVTTADRVILAALLSQEGTVTVNRAATARLLADRLALLRHLIVAEIPVPETIVSFGEAATLQALESLGYPALLLPVQAGPAASEAIVHDADAGEAIVEHRGMLGHETAVLVQRQARGSLVRLAVVGTTIVGAELVCTTQTGSPHHAPYDRFSPALDEIAERVIGRLGSGVYEIRVVETINGPLVVGAGNLVDFRSLSQAGIDIAGQIADFALSQHAQTVGEREIRRG